MAPRVHGVHLVGSIPLNNTEEVVRTVSEALPERLRRIPDGETGERWYFASWQAPILNQWPLIFNPLTRGYMKASPLEMPSYTESEKRALFKDMEEKLEVRYDEFALESYQVFKKLKAEGVVGKNVRFLVAVPSPVTITALYVREGFQVEFEEVYEGALLKALRRVQSIISSGELSIQWDCPFEMGMIDGAELPGRHVDKWWEDSMVEGIVKRLARICGQIEAGVEMGVHLCYGDMQGKHFIEPKDTRSLVDVATGLLERCKRRIDFIHLPVPKNRTDEAYFEALSGLQGYVSQGHELCLGLLHSGDLEDTQRRISAAGKFVSAFSVSSECGLGRKTKDEFRSVLEIALSVSGPVSSKSRGQL